MQNNLSKINEKTITKEIKSLQSIYNEITKLLIENNVIINITPPRPFLERDGECLYFDEAWKFKNFD